MTSVIVGRPGRVDVRTATCADLLAIRDMLLRCSAAALRDRTHGGVRPEPLVDALRRNLSDGRGAVLVAVRDGRVVGCLELVRADCDAPCADLALLVEDAWQGRGIGGNLVSEARALVREVGVDAVTFSVEAANTRARRLTTRFLGGDETARIDGAWHDGVFDATVLLGGGSTVTA